MPFEVVRNGTTGQADMVAAEEPMRAEPFISSENRVMESGSKDLFGRRKDIDYLDIPSFLRTQAD